ncbi:MAG TPA: DUF4846 domain-containing protein [Myxococcales bacterium]|nr:DUF4846 domain-containing protein [Myxococcales bacterium]
MRFRAALLVLAGLGYPFAKADREDLAHRIAPPTGAVRTRLDPGTFGDWLRHLPLLPEGAQVHLYDGRLKARQDVHAAVVDLDVGNRDLQQCADAVMRLRAEYLWAAGREGEISFHPQPGKATALAWTGGRDRRAFAKFLIRVMAQAGTASLAAELAPVGQRPLEPGDVLIHPGYPGHAVLVLDAAQGADGRRYLLLGQSYMPAQQFHVLRNASDPSLSPWFEAGPSIRTPEWPRPFEPGDARRF